MKTELDDDAVILMSPQRMRRLRRLSSVRRWANVPMLRHQSVSEHSFNLVPIALWLAQFHRTLDVVEDGPRIIMHCLLHDEGEAVSGDPPSPIKQIIGPVLRDWEAEKGYGPEKDPVVRNLVKVADCLEALMFVYEDEQMGNQTLSVVFYDIRSKLYAAWAEFDWIITGSNSNKFSVDRLVTLMQEIFNPSIHPIMEGV